LAWVRTSTSLISFGFSIYKFFQYMQESNPVRGGQSWIGPRGFALMMLATGVVVLVIATAEHRRSMVALRAEYRIVPNSLATVLAAFISLLGVLGLIAVVFRL
jgi:putative membrane protein